MTSTPEPPSAGAAAAPGGAARLGLVVIGRNEGERLRRCLESVNAAGVPTVYVDSGSTDGSPEAARALGAEVLALDMSRPFTAARARNAGFERLAEIAPELDLVQFVDGDCELDAGWLPRAAAFLRGHPRAAIVCGRLRERHPERTVYNRLCDIEWDTPVGEVESCGGIFLIRAADFESVGGFAEGMIAGEEPDLCWRLRRAGRTVHRIEAEMALHDADMSRFRQWWTRNKRSGHATAEAFERRGGLRDRAALRSVVSNVLWALPPFWVLWPLLFWRVYRRRPDAAYAAFIVLGKLPHLSGQVSYAASRLRNRSQRLIEYK